MRMVAFLGAYAFIPLGGQCELPRATLLEQVPQLSKLINGVLPFLPAERKGLTIPCILFCAAGYFTQVDRCPSSSYVKALSA